MSLERLKGLNLVKSFLFLSFVRPSSLIICLIKGVISIVSEPSKAISFSSSTEMSFLRINLNKHFDK